MSELTLNFQFCGFTINVFFQKKENLLVVVMNFLLSGCYKDFSYELNFLLFL